MRGWSRSHWNYLTFDAGESSSPVLMFLSIRTTAFSLTNIFFPKKIISYQCVLHEHVKKYREYFAKNVKKIIIYSIELGKKNSFLRDKNVPHLAFIGKKNSPCLLDGYESCWSLFRPSDLQYTVWHNIFFILPRKFRHKWIILLFWSQTFTFFWNKL